MLMESPDVYTLCFPQDRRGVKVLGTSMTSSKYYLPASHLIFVAVYGIYATMIVCLCLDAADLHFWFAAGFDPVKFQRARFSGVNGPIVGSLVGLCTQLFFAYRISMFRQAVWLSGVVVVVRPVASSKYIADAYRPRSFPHLYRFP
jgi:hypothetical protein